MITPRDSHVVNLAERVLNKDLDGDGDIGVAEQPYVAYGAEFSVGTCSCGLPTTTCVSRLLSGLIILPLAVADTTPRALHDEGLAHLRNRAPAQARSSLSELERHHPSDGHTSLGHVVKAVQVFAWFAC